MGSYIVPIIPIQSVDASKNKILGGSKHPPNYKILIVVGTLRVPSQITDYTLNSSRHSPSAVSKSLITHPEKLTY